jgi:hypothetical protein
MSKKLGGNIYYIVIDKAGFTEMITSQPFSDLCFNIAGKVADRLGSGYRAERWARPSRAAANVVNDDPGEKFREASTGRVTREVRSMKLGA